MQIMFAETSPIPNSSKYKFLLHKGKVESMKSPKEKKVYLDERV
jgi:hypothetical protein